MTRPEMPTRREEARQPEAGSPLMRRYAPLSLVLHAVGFAVLSLPTLHPERPVFAEPIYQVALLPSVEPNYEPPVPATPPQPEPKPVKTPKKETKPKDTVPVKSARAKPQAEVKAPEKTVEQPKVETQAKAPAAEERPVSLGQVDQQNFREDWYLERLRAILAQAWDPPSGGEGVLTANVHFRILRSGAIEACEITGSSGWSLYDRSALAAVLNTRSLPPLPEAYEGDHLGLTVTFQRVGDTASDGTTGGPP